MKKKNLQINNIEEKPSLQSLNSNKNQLSTNNKISSILQPTLSNNYIQEEIKDYSNIPSLKYKIDKAFANNNLHNFQSSTPKSNNVFLTKFEELMKVNLKLKQSELKKAEKLDKTINLLKELKSANKKLIERATFNNKLEEEVVILQEKNYRLNEQINLIYTENSKLKILVQEKLNELANFQNAYEINNNHIKEIEEENLELNKKLITLNATIKELEVSSKYKSDIETSPLLNRASNFSFTNKQQFRESNFYAERNLSLNKEAEYLNEINYLKQELKQKEEIKNLEIEKEVTSVKKAIEVFKYENEKLKKDITKMKETFKKKEEEYQDQTNHLAGILNETSSEIEDIKKKYQEKISTIENLSNDIKDKDNEIRSMSNYIENLETKLDQELIAKDKKIEILNEERKKTLNKVEDLECKLREKNIESESLKKKIDEVYSYKVELINEFEQKQKEWFMLEENKLKDLNLISESYEKFERVNQTLMRDNEELKRSLNFSTNKINELNKLIESKYLPLERSFYSEIQTKESYEREYKELLKKFNDNERKYYKEINSMKSFSEHKNQEMMKFKAKYEDQISKLKKKLEEIVQIKRNKLDNNIVIMNSKINKLLKGNSENSNYKDRDNNGNNEDSYRQERDFIKIYSTDQ